MGEKQVERTTTKKTRQEEDIGKSSEPLYTLTSGKNHDKEHSIDQTEADWKWRRSL